MNSSVYVQHCDKTCELYVTVPDCTCIVWLGHAQFLFIPCPTIVAGYYDFTLDVLVSISPSYVVRLSIHPFSFPDDNLSKHQWIFTKLGLCINIMEVWFGIANGQIASNFMELSARDAHIFVSG